VALARAIELLQEVVEGEPDYAPGLAQLAEGYLLSGGFIDNEPDFQERLGLILGLVDRALAIDTSLAGAFAVRGNVAMERGAYVDALDDYRLAIELDADDPRSHHWLALLYSDAGHLDRGEQAIAESLRLDPENANAQAWRADFLAVRGEWEAALELAREVVDLGNPVGHGSIAMYLLAQDPVGNLDRAESELRLALTKGAPPEQVALEIVEVARGDEAALESVLDDVRANRLWVYWASTALLVLERREALLTLLEWDDFLYHRLGALVWSPEHAPLRRDPRFVAYLRRWGVTDLWREIGPPPDCRAEGDSFVCGLVEAREP
jgi:tetratricopeptide (TPR) repeat protein